MARRKDHEIRENVDRGHGNEQGSAGIDAGNTNYKNDDGSNPSDTIKNANAAGLGAIGRNDEKQTGYTSNQAADAGD